MKSNFLNYYCWLLHVIGAIFFFSCYSVNGSAPFFMKKNDDIPTSTLDHSSHPYGFEWSIPEALNHHYSPSSISVQDVNSNYLLVSSVYSQPNTPLSYSHYELKNESFPFIKNQKVSGNLLRVKVVNRGHFQIIAPYGRCCQPSTSTNPTMTSTIHHHHKEYGTFNLFKSPSPDTDPCKERTSTTAKQNDCLVATNAGFFCTSWLLYWTSDFEWKAVKFCFWTQCCIWIYRQCKSPSIFVWIFE